MAPWINGSNVHSLRGAHAGWFSGGVVYDGTNGALAFTADHTGSIPFQPGLAGTPGVPGFAGRPGRPGLAGAPGRPGYYGWAKAEASTYFKD
ncbi:4-fold beta flower protein [Cupriavidus necator]|uniref:4-fold beta flower protein n=1 Tax=Cupriavidus necator TaxID=106590 RepID=UPI003F501AB6